MALSGMLVPLAIHLWNSRQNKTLQVGSIAFMEENRRSSARQIRISEWLLLLLRCLLVALLALLLAKPVWKQTAAIQTKGWLLVDRAFLQPTYAQFKPAIDSLLHAGYQLHYLNSGFEEGHIRDTANAATAMDTTVSYWQLFAQLDQQLGAGIPLVLFTHNLAGRFSGNRPLTQRQVQWYTYTPVNNTADWIAAAYYTPQDSVHVISAQSGSEGTVYVPTNIAAHNNHTTFQLSTQNGQLTVALPGRQPVAVDTSVLRITLFAGNNSPDAAYVTAAVDAIRQYSQRRIQLTKASDKTLLPAAQDWLFWLSEEPLPANSRATHVFAYAAGKNAQRYSWINTAVAGITEPIALQRSELPAGRTGTVVWKDGFGSPLLTCEQNGQQFLYRFYSRFNPAWNELPWAASFPALLMQLLIPGVEESGHDARTIDASQVQPVYAPAANVAAASSSAVKQTDLSHLFWLLIFIVFLAERTCAALQQKRRVNAKA